MSELNLEKFNPTVAEIKAMVARYASLQIQGIDDKEGYFAVDTARKELKRVRVKITKTGKTMREEAVAFQKAVIAKEKELVELVEPTERELEAKQEAIDLEKEKLKRVSLLPERHARLVAVKYEATDDELLLLDETQFEALFNQKNAEYLAEKERVMLEEQARIEAEKKALQEQREEQEREARHQAELEQARKEAAERAVLEAERKAREAEEAKALAEKQRIEAEKAEQEKLEKQKRYTKFLSDNGYTEDTKQDFYIQRENNKVILFKKVAELKV